MLDEKHWHDIDASTDAEAVREYLIAEAYDPLDYDPGTPLYLLVRDNARDKKPRKVMFRVVPARFEVGR
jgi:hypothetical protein